MNYSKPIDKAEEGVSRMEEIADPRNITLEMEVLNNFEGYILNSAEENVKFVKR